MADFIINSDMGAAVFPVIGEREDFIPTGIPVLDVMRAFKEKTDASSYPGPSSLTNWANNRGFNEHMDADLDLKEIFIGVTEDSTCEEIISWMGGKIKNMEKNGPTAVVAMKTVFIPISTHDIMRMAKEETFGNHMILQENLDGPKKNEKGWFDDINGELIPNKWTTLPVQHQHSRLQLLLHSGKIPISAH
jgi:hypothetical protein